LPYTQAYIFEDYIKGRDYRIGDPYQLCEYYDEGRHLRELYPKAYGFNELNENPETEIYLNKGEIVDAETFKNQGPPIFTVQFTGGTAQGGAAKSAAEREDTSQRDMPLQLGQTVVNNLLRQGYRVVQVGHANDPALQGVIRYTLPFRRFIALCPVIAGHIGIDSSYMHACAAFKAPQLIFFEQTKPSNLGYFYEGAFNVIKPEGGYYRPRPSIPDNAGIYPFRHENEDKAKDWKQEEVIKEVEKFVRWSLENRMKKLYPKMRIESPKEQKDVRVENNGKKDA
jgi:hypothetical protein